MRRIAELLGVIALVAIYGFLLMKKQAETNPYAGESEADLCPNEQLDYSLREDCLDTYKDIAFADTTQLLNEVYGERSIISSADRAMGNYFCEMGIRMRIVELEHEKANAALPPNMRSDLNGKWDELQRFFDITLEYYDKLYGYGKEDRDRWNYTLAQESTIKELKRLAEEERTEYRYAMEIYHGEGVDNNDDDSSTCSGQADDED